MPSKRMNGVCVLVCGVFPLPEKTAKREGKGTVRKRRHSHTIDYLFAAKNRFKCQLQEYGSD